MQTGKLPTDPSPQGAVGGGAPHTGGLRGVAPPDENCGHSWIRTSDSWFVRPVL